MNKERRRGCEEEGGREGKEMRWSTKRDKKTTSGSNYECTLNIDITYFTRIVLGK